MGTRNWNYNYQGYLFKAAVNRRIVLPCLSAGGR